MVALAGALVVALNPPDSLRHQLSLSLSRQPAANVELILAPSQTTERAPRAGTSLDGRTYSFASVEIRAHAGDLSRQTVVMRVLRGRRSARTSTVVDVPSGAARTIRLAAPVPAGSGRWTAVITLPGRPERVLFHGGPRATP